MSEVVEGQAGDDIRLDCRTGEVWVNPDLDMSDKVRGLLLQLGSEVIERDRQIAVLHDGLRATTEILRAKRLAASQES